MVSRWAKVPVALVRTSEDYEWVVAQWWETMTMIAPAGELESFVMLGSGRGQRRLETTRVQGFLKDFFKRQGCWGLPQQLLATVGCVGSFKGKVLRRSAHSKVAQRLREIQMTRDNRVDSSYGKSTGDVVCLNKWGPGTQTKQCSQ